MKLINIWQTSIPEEQEARIGYKSSGIFRLQITPDNKYAVTLNYQYRELIVWDFISGEKLFSRSWGGYDKVRGLYLTPDGNYAVVTGETGGVVSIENNHLQVPYPLPPDEQVLVNIEIKRAISSNGLRAKVWDFEKKQFSIDLEIPNIKRNEINQFDPLQIKSISMDGKFGSCMFDNHALIWDLESGKCMWQYDFTKRKPRNLIFCPDSQQVIVDNGSIIEIWQWKKDKTDNRSFETNGRNIHSPVFTPNGQLLIWGTDDGSIQIWDWQNAKLQKTLGGHKYPIECLAVSSDGEYLASTSDDTTLRKWHIASGKQIFSTLPAEDNLDLISINPNGRFVISPYGLDKDTLAIHELATGKLEGILRGHCGNINAIDYLSDEHIITASNDHTLRIWNVKSGQCLKVLDGKHYGKVQSVVVTDNQEEFVSASSDGRIAFWNSKTYRPIKPYLQYASPKVWTEQYIFIDKHGKLAITKKSYNNSKSSISILLDLETGKELLEWHYKGMLSPTAHWLVQVQEPPKLSHLRIINLRMQQTIQIEIENKLGHLWSFTSDEKKLVCSSDLNKIVVIDLESGDFKFASIKGNSRITSLTISPDGKLGAVAVDKHIRIWDLSSGDELTSLNIEKTFFKLVFPPSNRYLLAGDNDMILYCFELKEFVN